MLSLTATDRSATYLSVVLLSPPTGYFSASRIPCVVSRVSCTPCHHSAVLRVVLPYLLPLSPSVVLTCKPLPCPRAHTHTHTHLTSSCVYQVAQFRRMLEEKSVPAFANWEKWLPKLVADARFLLLPKDDRRSVFTEYVKSRVRHVISVRRFYLCQGSRPNTESVLWVCTHCVSVTMLAHIEPVRSVAAYVRSV